MPLLEVDGVSHAYGKQAVVRELSFDLAQGEIACLLGASFEFLEQPLGPDELGGEDGDARLASDL